MTRQLAATLRRQVKILYPPPNRESDERQRENKTIKKSVKAN